MLIIDIIYRLKQHLKVKSDASIARSLGVKPQNIINWKKRGTIPWPELCEFVIKNKLSFDWLFLGKDRASELCTLPPGSDEFCKMLKEILIQSTDEQVKNALRTNLVAFKNSVDKDVEKADKDKKLEELEHSYSDLAKKVHYLEEVYDQKTKSDT